MSDAKERLTYLLELAERRTPEARRRLVDELCALLLDWPEAYPLSMRTHFDRLLEKAAQKVDAQTRAALAERFAALPDAPVGLLNELFFDAPDAVKAAILRRNALANDAARAEAICGGTEESALIEAARARSRDGLANAFARALGLDGTLAARILDEPTGDALAAACKGAHLKRATYSTLALLMAPDAAAKEARLGAYDAVPQEGAESLMRFWRGQTRPAHGRETEAA